jgi:Fe-S cluster assembly scaffold protein SufB
MTRVLHTKRNGTSRQVYHGFASRGEYGLRSFKYFTFNFLGEANGIQGSEKAGREKSQVRNPRLMLSLKSAQSSCPIVII